eukprot:3418922-Amphidinium_carterae.2
MHCLEEFFQSYALQRRPCIIEGAIDEWPAMHKWEIGLLPAEVLRSKKYGQQTKIMQGGRCTFAFTACGAAFNIVPLLRLFGKQFVRLQLDLYLRFASCCTLSDPRPLLHAREFQ